MDVASNASDLSFNAVSSNYTAFPPIYNVGRRVLRGKNAHFFASYANSVPMRSLYRQAFRAKQKSGVKNSTSLLVFFRVDLKVYCPLPQQFLYFFPLPQGQGSLRPTFGDLRRNVSTLWSLLASIASS